MYIMQNNFIQNLYIYSSGLYNFLFDSVLLGKWPHRALSSIIDYVTLRPH